MKKAMKSGITGWLAIIADIVTLIGFATGFIKPNTSKFFLHPAFLLVLQLTITIYGNIALVYSYVHKINDIYLPRKVYNPKDIKSTLMLFVNLTWIPSYLIWVVSYVLITYSYQYLIVLHVFVGIGSIVSFLGGGEMLADCGTLITRTLHPELPIRIILYEGDQTANIQKSYPKD